jgi:hypothetical protein
MPAFVSSAITALALSPFSWPFHHLPWHQMPVTQTVPRSARQGGVFVVRAHGKGAHLGVYVRTASHEQRINCRRGTPTVR